MHLNHWTLLWYSSCYLEYRLSRSDIHSLEKIEQCFWAARFNETHYSLNYVKIEWSSFTIIDLDFPRIEYLKFRTQNLWCICRICTHVHVVIVVDPLVISRLVVTDALESRTFVVLTIVLSETAAVVWVVSVVSVWDSHTANKLEQYSGADLTKLTSLDISVLCVQTVINSVTKLKSSHGQNTIDNGANVV